MEQQTEDQRIIKQYLLGTLDQDARRHLEERLFTEDKCLEELSAAEDELIDEYVAGALAAHERAQFESHFLASPERHRKLKFARSLKRYIATTGAAESAKTSIVSQPSSSKQWFSFFLPTNNAARAVPLATALLLIFGMAVVFEIQRRRNQAGTEQSAHAARGKDLGADRQPAASYFAVTLTPGLTRGAGEIRKVLVPAGVDTLRLRLELAADDYPSYRAILQTDEGRAISTKDRLAAEAVGGGKIVAVELPAELLSRGDYQVKLGGLTATGGFEDVGSYPFRVPGK